MTPQPRKRLLFVGKFGTTVALVALVGCALFLRSFFLLDQVFQPDYVCFQENDPWYHVRAIEHLVAHFPHILTWDPYALHPGGQYIAIGPMFDVAVVSVALILGVGTPSLELTHAIAAWFPAVLGSLIPIPTYFLGRRLWNTRAGLLAAATIAVLPGPFFQRSSLGYTDHHVAESLLSLLTLYFSITLLQSTKLSNRANELGERSPRANRRCGQGIYTVLCGVSLGSYLLTWVGGSLFVLALFIAFIIHVVVEQARGESVHRTCLWIVVAWLIALGMVFPFRRTPMFHYHIVALIASGFYFILAGALGRAVEVRHARRSFFPIGLLLLAFSGWAVMRFAAPAVFSEAVSGVTRFISGQAGSFLLEARPLLYENGALTLRPAFEMFQASILTAILALGLLSVQVLRDLVLAHARQSTARLRSVALSAIGTDRAHGHGRSASCGVPDSDRRVGVVFFLVCTFAAFLATLVQERFAYYLAINIALLSGCFWNFVYETASRRWTRLDPFLKKAGPALVYAVIFAVGIYPSASRSFSYQARLHTGPHADWHDAMNWLRTHSPEPFDHVDRFEQSYDTCSEQEPASRPRASYSVMCSWDHGYWITSMAQRVPTANPTQSGLQQAAAFFSALDEDSAVQVLTQLDARYVVVDADLPVRFAKETREFVGAFGTIAGLVGHDVFEYYEPYLVPDKDGSYTPVVLYYPEYYRSMLSRLYLFGGQEYVPKGTTGAIRFTHITTADGLSGKRIEQGLKFSSYEKAAEFVSRREGESWRIVGLSPTESCVPLEKLRYFQLAYQSPTQPSWAHTRTMGVVEIFERLAPQLPYP